MTVKTYFPVRFTEIDAMGIVHHSNYAIWFEAGRMDFLKNAGMPSSKLNSRGLFLPLTDLKCSFKSPAGYGDKILVTTSLVYMSCVKLKFEYKVFNKSTGKLLATGMTTHAWTNKRIEPLNIEKTAPEIYEKLKQLVEAGEMLFTTPS